jgi:hypothetical protein
MSDFVGIDVKGLEPLIRGFNNLTPTAQDMVVDNVSVYLLDTLRHYPSYKYVGRRAAYPPTGWQSEKQRKYVMAKITEGDIRIPYRRTQEMARAWKKIGGGAQAIIVNETEAAYYTMDDQGQARLNALMGWQKIKAIIEQRRAKILQIANAAVKRAARKVGISMD